MTTRTERGRGWVSAVFGRACLAGLAAFGPLAVGPPALAQTGNPLVFEEAPPTRLRTETDGGPVTDRCRQLAQVITRDLQGQPQRRATLLQFYQRECPGQPLPP
ncbi:MAG: hypothetical protein MUF66_11105 [Gammaproteobacteria bacterium]|nr:hypothetical protein [Gammaproteobacteria bacterium]